MSFVVRKLPLAEQDALEAAIWYEAREPGLGDEFLTEVDRAVRTLSESALFYRIRFADVRRAPIQVLRRLLCRPRRRGLDIGDFSWAASSASAARRTQRDDVSARSTRPQSPTRAASVLPRKSAFWLAAETNRFTTANPSCGGLAAGAPQSFLDGATFESE
jgi:hypothetical protein